MSRISNTFAHLQSKGDKALITFITAGDPDLAATPGLILELERSGADIIELGVPFSDPMADGPTIQQSSQRALASGTTLHGILEAVRLVRRSSQVPIVLMGYYNPIFTYGVEKFAADASEAGIDGLIIVDLPPEEAADLKRCTDRHGIDFIFLLAPTSDEARIEKVRKLARGFIYYVSVTGVTGARQAVADSVSKAVAQIKGTTDIPVAVGFGISTAEQAAEIASVADGVVVGSAIVKRFEAGGGERLTKELRHFVAELKKGVAGAGKPRR